MHLLELAKELEKTAKAILSKGEKKTLWLPTQVRGDRFENVTQGLIVSKGPRRGKMIEHGEFTNKPYWKKGQHIMKRQRNPKDPEMQILGTRELFRNSRIDVKALRNESDLVGGSQGDQVKAANMGDGMPVVLGWGKWKTVREGLSQWDEMTADEMLSMARQIRRGLANDDLLTAARQLLASYVGTTNQPTASRESEIVQGSVAIEGHN